MILNPTTGGGGLNPDGSTTGATTSTQKFTKGITVGAAGTDQGVITFYDSAGAHTIAFRITTTNATPRQWLHVANFTGNRTFTWPDANVTLVGDTNTQTLSGKTLTSPVLNNPATNNPTVNTGMPAGTGFQHIRTASNATGVTAFSTVDTTVTWAVPFADTNYSVVVTIDTPTGTPIVASTNSKTTTDCVVTIINALAGAASGTLNVIAVHD